MRRLQAMPPDRAPRCAGFTLVELLVVIAIVGILVGLLLPAIQSSREAARRSECKNNLKQMGVALALHESTLGAWPVGSADHGGKQTCWMVPLLTFLEADNIRELYRFDRKYSHPDNRAAVSHVIPTFLCPSATQMAIGRDGQTSGDKNKNGAYDAGDWMGLTDYGGNYGAGGAIPLDNGLLVYGRALRSKDVFDGTSHTIIVSEDTGRGWVWDGEWANGGNVFDQIGAPNLEQNNEMWSDHPGGVLVLLADGSVHFVANTVNTALLRASCSRAGKEVQTVVWDD